MLFLICWRAYYYFTFYSLLPVIFFSFIRYNIGIIMFSLMVWRYKRIRYIAKFESFFFLCTKQKVRQKYEEKETTKVKEERWCLCIDAQEMHERIQWTKECQCNLMHTHIQNSCHSLEPIQYSNTHAHILLRIFQVQKERRIRLVFDIKGTEERMKIEK